MSTTFYTKERVDGSLNLTRSDIIFQDPEDDFRSAEVWQDEMTAAFQRAEMKEGDTVFVTVAYSDGTFKPANTRNMRMMVTYKTYETGVEVDIQIPPRKEA